jgi:hypothetical protein
VQVPGAPAALPVALLVVVPVMLLVAERNDCAEAKELAEAKDSGLMRSRGVAVLPSAAEPFG